MKIKEEEYEAWCSHPMTMKFRQEIVERAGIIEKGRNLFDPAGVEAHEFHSKSLQQITMAKTLSFVGDLLSGKEFNELNEDEEEGNE